jgi:hypothetical protein
VIQNLSNHELQVTLDVTAPATGLHFSRAPIIEPNRVRKFGYTEGWEFTAGQEITLNNTQFRPRTVTVST